MQRSRETCELAGLGHRAVIDADLVEWNYGEYEGLMAKQIHETAPGWLIFRNGCPGGEAPEQVAARADRVIARAHAAEGDVALFAHGHVLRVLAARWIGLPAGGGQHFLLDTGTLCVLSYYRDIPAVKVWNDPSSVSATIGREVETGRMRMTGERTMRQPESERAISRDQYDAILLDLDGVITDTATVHASCWKQMFDEYVQRRATQ
jgi:probable phosphoglycerate mutase